MNAASRRPRRLPPRVEHDRRRVRVVRCYRAGRAPSAAPPAPVGAPTPGGPPPAARPPPAAPPRAPRAPVARIRRGIECGPPADAAETERLVEGARRVHEAGER